MIKGHFAKALFRHFTQSNGLPFDFDSYDTAFYKIRMADFKYKQIEFKQLNNMLHHPGDLLLATEYAQLPALIPNRFANDAWKKKNSPSHPDCDYIGFVFTFLKEADYYRKGKSFFDFECTPLQWQFLAELRTNFRNIKHGEGPFEEDWFWKEWNERGGSFGFGFFRLPSLVITAIASQNQWDLFEPMAEGSQSYGKDALISVINNMGCPIHKLPAFSDVFVPESGYWDGAN